MPRLKFLVAFLTTSLLISACRQKEAPPEDRTFVIMQEDDIFGLSPNRSLEWVTSSVQSNVYESLVALDPSMMIVPALAESWENPDRLTWIFHLRKGVRYHDGRIMKARDVKYTFDTVRADPPPEFGDILASVSDVSVIDDSTVGLKTATPIRLLNDLTYIKIIPEGAVLGDDSNPPPGTGPYRVTEWKRGERVRLTAVRGYWGGDPVVKRAIFLPVSDGVERLHGVMTGQADLVPDPPLDRVAELTSSDTVRIMTRRGLMVTFLVFDTARDRIAVMPGKNPFRDHRVRMAFALAVDRASIVEGVLHGYASEATQLVAPDVFGYNMGIRNPPRDLQKARALLVEAGYPDGFRVPILARQFRRDVAMAVRDQLRQIGVELDVQVSSGQEFFETLHAGRSCLAMIGWNCDTGDSQALYDFWLRGVPGKQPAWLGELGKYSNSEVENILRVLSSTIDQRERLELLTRANELVMRDLPWLPLYVDHLTYALSNRYDMILRADGNVVLSDIRLSGS